jgi:cytochrome P450
MFPWWNRYVLRLPHLDNGPAGFRSTMLVCGQRIQDRATGNDAEHHSPGNPDFLDKFFEARATHPDTTDDGHVITWLMGNLLAGADSTCSALCSVLYFTLKNPRVWKRLQDEISATGFRAEGAPFSYKAAHGLPYLEAVIHESLRMLPSVLIALERYVPAEGYRTAAGAFLPGGTVVGINPYVMGRNREVYGEDVDVFRPERWLCDAEAGEGISELEKRLAAMNASIFTFGRGSRACIGKNVALLQVYKVVATMVGRYDIGLVDPEKDWEVTGSWFFRQRGIDVRITRKARSGL